MNNFPTSDSLATLAQAREAYVTLLAAHKTALSETEAVRGDLSAASEMLDEANQAISSLQKELTDANKARDTATADLANAQQRIEALDTEIAKLQAEAKTTEARAAEICASVGVDPVQVTPEGDAKAADVREQLRSIKDPGKRTAFFRKHKSELTAE